MELKARIEARLLRAAADMYQYKTIIRLYTQGAEDCDIADELGIEESVVADVIDAYEGVKK